MMDDHPGTLLLSLCLELLNAENHIEEARERGAVDSEAVWEHRYRLSYDELTSKAPWVAARYRSPDERP